MATYSNHFKYQCLRKQVDLLNDSIKAILMGTGFVFSRDNHATYADVVASELASGNGYTQNSKVLTNQQVFEDDANDKAYMSADNVEWVATGGSIGPVAGILFYDDSTSDNTVICYQPFSTEQTAAVGEKILGTGISFEF